MKSVIAWTFALTALISFGSFAYDDVVAANAPLVDISTRSFEHDANGYIWYSHEIYVTPLEDNLLIKDVVVNRGRSCGPYPSNRKNVRLNYGQKVMYKFLTRTREVCDLIEINVVTDKGDMVFKR